MGIIAAEVFKLWRLRAMWVLLAVMVAIEALMIGGMSFWVLVSSADARVTPEDRRAIETATSFPTCLLPTLSFVASLGPLFAMTLAARVAGDEYSHGTARQLVSMGVRRRAYVAAKLAAIALACLALLVGATASASAISLAMGAALGRRTDLGVLAAPFLARVARGAGIAWLSLGCWSALAFFLAILTRSAASATAIGILAFLLEGNLVGFLAARFPLVGRIAPYTMGRNLSLIVALIEGGPGVEAASPYHARWALAVVAAWIGAYAVGAAFAFSRQDLSGD